MKKQNTNIIAVRKTAELQSRDKNHLGRICYQSIDILGPCFSNCGSKTNNISIIWELLRNAEVQALTHTYWIRMCILTRFPGDSYVQKV